MPSVAFFSFFTVDKDAGQLLPEDVGQLNDTEQISEEMQQFKQELHKEVLLPSLPLRISSMKKNDRDIDSEVSEATTSKKKSKIMRILSTVTKQWRKKKTRCTITMMKRSITLYHQYPTQREVVMRLILSRICELWWNF